MAEDGGKREGEKGGREGGEGEEGEGEREERERERERAINKQRHKEIGKEEGRKLLEDKREKKTENIFRGIGTETINI